jgi:hypothetical protein
MAHLEGTTLGKNAVEPGALHALHHHEGLAVGEQAVVGDLHHVRVANARRGARLGQEAAHHDGVFRHRALHQLDGHRPADERVLRCEHHAHAAGPERRQHLVRSDGATRAWVVDHVDQVGLILLAAIEPSGLQRAAARAALERPAGGAAGLGRGARDQPHLRVETRGAGPHREQHLARSRAGTHLQTHHGGRVRGCAKRRHGVETPVRGDAHHGSRRAIGAQPERPQGGAPPLDDQERALARVGLENDQIGAGDHRQGEHQIRQRARRDRLGEVRHARHAGRRARVDQHGVGEGHLRIGHGVSTPAPSLFTSSRSYLKVRGTRQPCPTSSNTSRTLRVRPAPPRGVPMSAGWRCPPRRWHPPSAQTGTASPRDLTRTGRRASEPERHLAPFKRSSSASSAATRASAAAARLASSSALDGRVRRAWRKMASPEAPLPRWAISAACASGRSPTWRRSR